MTGTGGAGNTERVIASSIWEAPRPDEPGRERDNGVNWPVSVTEGKPRPITSSQFTRRKGWSGGHQVGFVVHTQECSPLGWFCAWTRSALAVALEAGVQP